MNSKILLVCSAALSLSACDAAMEQVGGQVRTAVLDQCLQVSENIGIGSEFVTPVCECTADTFMEKNSGELAQVDRTRVAEIVRDCASEADVDPTADLIADPVENTGA